MSSLFKPDCAQMLMKHRIGLFLGKGCDGFKNGISHSQTDSVGFSKPLTVSIRLITVFILFGTSGVFAQNINSCLENIDVSKNEYSLVLLQKRLKQAKANKNKVLALNEIAWYYNHGYERLENADSSIFYAKKAREICEDLKESDNAFATQESILAQQILLSAAKKKGAPRDSVYRVFNSMKKWSVENSDNRNLAAAYYNLGKYASRWDSADFYFQEAVELSDSLGYHNLLAHALACLEIPDVTSGINFGNRAAKAFIKAKNYIGLANALVDIGKIHLWSEQEDSTIIYYRNSIELAKRLESRALESRLHIKIAWLYRKFGFYEIGLEHFKQAESAALIVQNSGLLSEAYNGMGAMHDLQNNYPLALLNYLKAKTLFVQTKNRKGYAGVLHNIGRIYHAQSRYKLAIKHVKLALEENTKLENNYSLSNNNAELGEIYLSLKEYNLALPHFRRLLKLNEELGYHTHLDTLAIGRCYAGLKKYQKAYESYLKSQEMDRIYNPDNLSPNIPWRLSQLFFKLYEEKYDGTLFDLENQPISSSNFLSLAKKHIEQTVILEEKHEGYLTDKAQQAKLYSKILYASGSYDKAYLIRVKSQKIQDSVFNMEKEKDLAYVEYSQRAINDSLEFAQKEKIQALEIDEQKTRLTNQKRVLSIAFIGLVALASLAFWVYRSKQQIARRNQEKEVLLQEIHHRVKNNLQVIISLLSLQLRRVKDESGERVLEQSIGRIKTMSLIHQNLYQSDNLARTNFKTYLGDLMEQIMSSLEGVSEIDYTLSGDDMELTTDMSIPLALISFEWVNNIYKHAFPDKKGKVEIKLQKNKADYELSIADNGVGISQEEFMGSKDSLGAKIIKTLSRQVDAALTIERLAKGGTLFKLSLSK